jgi:hypothetical protein
MVIWLNLIISVGLRNRMVLQEFLPGGPSKKKKILAGTLCISGGIGL